MKKRIICLAAIMLVCLTAMSFLFILARASQRTVMGFSRNLAKTPDQSAALDLGKENCYIAGFDSTLIYLAIPNHFEILASNLPLTDLTIVNLLTPGKQIQASQIMIDSTAISVLDLHTSHIYQGNTYELVLKPFNVTGKFLTEALPISKGSFITRTWKADAQEFCIAKEYRNSPNLVRAPELLQNQVDGVFSTDGMLHFSRKLNRLIYLYYYRNEYVVFDTTLSLSYRANTVDTIKRAHVTVATDPSTKTRSLSTPALVTNKKSAVDGTFLYINSSVLGQHEDETEFYKSSAIDVYDLTRGAYTYSFYIPRYKKLPMKSFRILGNVLFAIHGHYLVRYTLNIFTP